MLMTIYTKNGMMQFWGSFRNPEHLGTAFDIACCPCGCFTFFEDFNWPDTTDLGADFYEYEGDWGVEDFRLVELYDDVVGTADAIVMCTQPRPNTPENGMWVSVSVDWDSAIVGDKYYIYACCLDYDRPDTGLKVEFEKTSASEWTTTIPGGGPDGVTVQVPTPFGDRGDVRLTVCVDHLTDMVKAGVLSLNDPPAWVDNLAVSEYRYAGVGHNNTSHQNIFDDFLISELRTSTEMCSNCWCWCLDRPPGRYLIATVYNAVDRAACIDGIDWSMDWEFDGAMSQWSGTSAFLNYLGATVTVDWILECTDSQDDDPAHPGKNFILRASATSCNFASPLNVYRALNTSTCDPLSLVFGPFVLSDGDLGCVICHNPMTGPSDGSFYIIITEAP
jgi:hypothetical protein